MKKILNILLLFCFCLIGAAQINDGVYKGFKVGKGSKNNTPDIINISVSYYQPGVGRQFSEEKDKPLNGCYHIIINQTKYIIANISKGVLEGEWTMYSNGDVKEKATFKNGCYDGQFISTYREREIYTYKDCKLQHYIAYHPNEKLKVERTYENGRLHGNVKEYNNKGELVDESNFANGEKHGKQIRIGIDGISTIENFNNGVQVGEYLIKYANGNIREKGEYDSNGKKTGKWIKNNENGYPREELNYKNDEYHGEVKKYDYDGKLSQFEEYVDGKNHGKYIIYHKYPVIREERTYENGNYGIKKYYTDRGELQQTYSYQEGMNIETSYSPGYENAGYTESYYKIDKKVGPNSTGISTYLVKEKQYDKNGNLKSLRLRNEKGEMVVVQEYNTAGKVTKTNKDYEKHASITLKESASGIIDIE